MKFPFFICLLEKAAISTSCLNVFLQTLLGPVLYLKKMLNMVSECYADSTLCCEIFQTYLYMMDIKVKHLMYPLSTCIKFSLSAR